ncbi:MAG: protein serine/threonine phosphatase 2C family protein [Candidatus Protochlamydia sp.]|nr:protein serine/threonine phosphatase 2C family protein [Candidatus Protochlamydia sp.]
MPLENINNIYSENFSLTAQLTRKLEDLNHSAPLSSRVLGVVAIPFASLADALTHGSLASLKATTGVFVSPYNCLAFLFFPSYTIKKNLRLSDSLVHLMRAIECIFTGALLPFLHLFDPLRSNKRLNPALNASIIEERNIYLEQELGRLQLEIARKDTRIQEILERSEQGQPHHILLLNKNSNYALIAQNNESAKGFEIISMQPPEEANGHRFASHEFTMGNKSAGFALTQGRRPTMEDAEIAYHGNLAIGGQACPFDLFGIFDGHGGANVSAFVKEHIIQVFQMQILMQNMTSLNDEKKIYKALKETFLQLDQMNTFLCEGTTATVAVLLGNKIWVANVGDSRTILVKRDGTVIQASEDASPDNIRFNRKITKLGGHVIGDRVISGNSASLGVARAIGDHGFQALQNGKTNKIIVPNPKLTCYDFEDFSGGHLALACDGLYDVAATSEIGRALHQMEHSNLTPAQKARCLVHSAYEKGSTDNISVMVVKL